VYESAENNDPQKAPKSTEVRCWQSFLCPAVNSVDELLPGVNKKETDEKQNVRKPETTRKHARE